MSIAAFLKITYIFLLSFVTFESDCVILPKYESEKRMNFNELNLNEQLLRAVTEMGYQEPSEIQTAAIPVMLSGKDLIGQSQTGSGKTAAFGLPILQMIEPAKDRKTQALILAPTRELCLQVADEMRKFAKYMEGVRIISVYGGQDIQRQINDIKGGSDIVVATPGRLLDHMRRKTLRFHNCNQVVLDEADEMLNMGFLDEIKEVFAQLPSERQTVLFSATMPKPILELANVILKNPEHIKLNQKHLTVSTIKQDAYLVLPSQKTDLLIQLIELNNVNQTMVFCNTKRMVDDLNAALNKQGFLSMGLHGDMKQEMRTSIMKRFKEKQIHLLIATDVAARGIDVDDMDMVINYDLPQEIEYYVHRIGRTGRAGREGRAISFVSPRQRTVLSQIEKITRQSVELKPLPTKEDLEVMTTDLIENEIRKGLALNVSVQDIISQLSDRGLDAKHIIIGLLSKVVESHQLKAIQPVNDRKSKDRGPRDLSTLVFNLGKNQGIAPAHLISAIAESCNIRGSEIGKIIINDRQSMVEVPRHMEREIVDIMNKTPIKGKVPYVSITGKPVKEKQHRSKGHFNKPKSSR